MTAEPRPPAWKVLSAFAIIYVVWGSTFLAIRIGVHDVPPFLLAAMRFLVAGLALVGWTLARGERPPTAREWRSVLLLALLIFVGNYGLVFWAEQVVPSSVTALTNSSFDLGGAAVHPAGAAALNAGAVLGRFGLAQPAIRHGLPSQLWPEDLAIAPTVMTVFGRARVFRRTKGPGASSRSDGLAFRLWSPSGRTNPTTAQPEIGLSPVGRGGHSTERLQRQ